MNTQKCHNKFGAFVAAVVGFVSLAAFQEIAALAVCCHYVDSRHTHTHISGLSLEINSQSPVHLASMTG